MDSLPTIYFLLPQDYIKGKRDHPFFKGGNKMLGIKHIEFWVSNLKESMEFYAPLFEIIGWERNDKKSFVCGASKIYFVQRRIPFVRSLGPRHICFHASTREMVDKVGTFLCAQGGSIIRGPIEMKGEEYSPGYYTVDFYDPDGCILEVAYSPPSQEIL